MKTNRNIMELILYSKPGCHLCEGLMEKLAQIDSLAIELEVRDITTNERWGAAYQYEIPVLVWRSPAGEITLPRLSPRAPVSQLEKLLQQYVNG
ncbi:MULTISPECIES: glutaredoxin family protein [unclassified Synechocystis]|uniref:glutaredoxin family protein n=1 Tax=unclassified Synechocystis TaxID=2640012 RepID=UPI00048F65A6|nr:MULTISPECIES: glutaredoxin family protein [unclassified Synechocystis]MCT0254098.1 glutaredoxin family protein [Synechocystis sp. CS-94]